MTHVSLFRQQGLSMAYNIYTTEEMEYLLDKSVSYLLNKFKSEQAAKHLLAGVSNIYDTLEDNPFLYRVSDDPYMKSMNYHEAKVKDMDYMVIYKVVDNDVYMLGIFHTLEKYSEKMRFTWNAFNPNRNDS